MPTPTDRESDSYSTRTGRRTKSAEKRSGKNADMQSGSAAKSANGSDATSPNASRASKGEATLSQPQSTRSQAVSKASSAKRTQLGGGKRRFTIKHSDGPLVSVIMFVRNGMPHVERAVESVLSQKYDNLEFVIQDGMSDDGTREFIQGLDDPRIKLISRRDKGPADAFSKAIARADGDIIASCLADEELCPDALLRVVELFRKFPYLGAITGDADISDIHGRVYAKFEGAPFNLLKYLEGSYCPYWCSSFFSRSALEFVGIFDQRWSKASLEFEVWCRLAMETDILYVPQIFSKYAHHSKQLSQAGDRAAEEIEARLEIIRTRLFGPGTYFEENYGQRDVFCLLQLINLHRHLSDWDPKAAEAVLRRIVGGGYLGEFNSIKRAEPNDQLVLAPEAYVAPPENVPLAAAQQMQPAIIQPPAERDKGDFIAMHEFIVPEEKFVGKVYRALAPVFVRQMIPRGLKVSIARGLGLRK